MKKKHEAKIRRVCGVGWKLVRAAWSKLREEEAKDTGRRLMSLVVKRKLQRQTQKGKDVLSPPNQRSLLVRFPSNSFVSCPASPQQAD